MSDGSSKEKRRFPRFEVSIPVILRRKAGEVNLRTVDISRHGAFVRIDPPLPLRQLVQLRFRVPDLGDVDAMCMVARSLGKDHPRGPGIGVDFFALSKDAKVIWERFVHKVRAHEIPAGAPVVTGVPLAPQVALSVQPAGPPIVQSHPLFPTSPPISVAPAARMPPVIAPPTMPVMPTMPTTSSMPMMPPVPTASASSAPADPVGQIPPRPVAEAAPAWFSPNSLTATQPFPSAPSGRPMAADVFAPVAPVTPRPPGAPPVTARGPVTSMMQAISLAQDAPAAQPIPPKPLPAVNTGVYRVTPQMQAHLAQTAGVPAPPAMPSASVHEATTRVPMPAPPVDEEDVVPLDFDDGAVVMLRVADREGLRAFVERDVARGGMFLKTPLVKEVGEKLALVVVHPETDDEFHLDATVVRRVITGPMEQRGLGIFFRSLSPDREAQLNDFIEGGIEVVELGTPISQLQLDLEGAVAREPDSPEALEALGVFLLDEEGDLGGALTALTRALVLGPSVVSIHASLARAYRKIGDSVKVRAHERVAESLMLMQERMKVRLGVGDD